MDVRLVANINYINNASRQVKWVEHDPSITKKEEGGEEKVISLTEEETLQGLRREMSKLIKEGSVISFNVGGKVVLVNTKQIVDLELDLNKEEVQ